METVLDLPETASIFDDLRKGRHISLEDSELFIALSGNYSHFETLFKSLGFALVRHPRDFFYFESEHSFNDLPTKIAVFMFILIDSLDAQGRSVEEVLLSEWIPISSLPHDKSPRYKRYLVDAGITVEKSIASLKRLGFAENKNGAIRFKTPVHRFIDLCLTVLHENIGKQQTEEVGV